MKRKIIYAFIVVALVPAVITIVAANLFARRELEEIRRNNSTVGLARLDANIVKDLAGVGSAAKNAAARPAWHRLFLRKRELSGVWQAQLIGGLAECNRQAQWDFSVIVDPQGVVLARGDRPSSFGDTIDFVSVFATAAIEKPTATASLPIPGVWASGGLLGVAPIIWQERTLAYLMVGKDFSVRHLREWVGGWAIPSLIIGPDRVLTRTEDAPEDTISQVLNDELYHGPRVSSVFLGDRRFLVARERLTNTAHGKPPLMVLLFFDAAPIDATMEKLFYSLLAAAGLGFILAIIFGFRAARMVTRPLDDIIEASKRISEGDWDADIISFSDGEVGRMADAFNRMIGDLRHSRDRLVQAERVAAWRDAARKVAHEIKNPLSPITVSAEDLLVAYQANDPEFKTTLQKSVKTIHEEVAAIKRFLDEFASFARLPRPVFAELEPRKLIEEAINAFPTEKKAGRITMDAVEMNGTKGDFELLKKSLVNLIKNGLEAGGPDGRVTLKVSDQDDFVQIDVEDTGPGISPEIKDKLFVPFVTDKPGGTGLGLVIVQGIAADHGGTITAEDNPGGGARFVLRLAKDPPPPPLAEG